MNGIEASVSKGKKYKSSSSSEPSRSEGAASKEQSKIKEKPTFSKRRKSKMIRILATATKARPSGSDVKDVSKKLEETKELFWTPFISLSISSSSSYSARELGGKESGEQKEESAPSKEATPSGKESSDTSSKKTSDTRASSEDKAPSEKKTLYFLRQSSFVLETGKEEMHIQLNVLCHPGAEKKERGSSASKLLK